MESLVKFSSNQKKFLTILCLSAFVFLAFFYLNLDNEVTRQSLEQSQTKKHSSHQFRNYLYPDFNSNNNNINTNLNKNDNEKIDSKFLFCLIKTTPNALKSNKTLTVFKVWASRCSNYRFITLIPDDLLNQSTKYGEHREIQMPFYLLQPEGLKVFILHIM